MLRTVVLTSRSNPIIKETLRLKNKPPGPEGGPVLIEGAHLVAEALDAGFDLDKIFISPTFLRSREHTLLLSRIASGATTLIEITDQIMSLLSDIETPAGVMGIASCVPAPLEEISCGHAPLLVIADGVRDPGNLGAIIRVSDAAAADAVIMMPGTCNAYTPKVVRATAGSIFHIPLVLTDHSRLTSFLNSKRIPLYATDARSPLSVFACDMKKGFALVLGNEAHGVSEGLRNAACKTLAIPIPGRAESINVAMAASVCLYEAVRQRGVPPSGVTR